MKGDQRRKAVHVEFLGFGQRLDSREFAFAKNTGGLDVFVNETLDGENQLIVKRRHRPLGQAAHIELESIGTATQAPH